MGTEAAVRACLLEGHRLLQDALGRCLEARGVRLVGCYSDVDAFLERIRETAPEVAIIGTLLPRSAHSIIERAHLMHPSQRIVLITSASDSKAVALCQSAGATAVLDRFSSGVEDITDAVFQVATAEPGARLPSQPRPRGHADSISGLSHRELEVLAHIGAGMDNLKIAALLGISEHTVKVHVGHLYRKLGRENRTEMALLARDLGVALPNN